ncbi:DNA-binding protein HEXBP-like isoform X1 [Carya illinoinensis]|uniref:DNA-binding protein HEXBP-like isoform X1 n=1 Tax=Carya illinoinensis TaxID=32201 RepID=UPI001C7191E0|nr:DNA-binding protein HEXBP-like isoform X1 [Carya illinoinensis]
MLTVKIYILNTYAIICWVLLILIRICLGLIYLPSFMAFLLDQSLFGGTLGFGFLLVFWRSHFQKWLRRLTLMYFFYILASFTVYQNNLICDDILLICSLSIFTVFGFVFSRDNLCKNCKRPGHYARECPNVAICHNCALPGHIASECTTKSLCWNCREPGHMANNCPNEGICHTCGKAGHLARECTALPLPPGDLRLCNNCYKQGHIAAECTNEKACNNCRKTGHLARECPNDPICNLCNVAGHMARQCPKTNLIGERGGGGGGGIRSNGYRDIICRNCQQIGHMSRDCMGPLTICHNCGGRGHLAYECPSARFMDRYTRRY